VELAQVELRSEPGRRPRAQLLDAQLADLVGERLPGPGDVAIDLVDDVVLALRGVRLEELDRLLARPALVVQAGVDDEPHGAPHLVGELAELVVGILVEPHFLAEALAVQRPALDERRRLEAAAEPRLVAEFLRERDLQVVPGTASWIDSTGIS